MRPSTHYIHAHTHEARKRLKEAVLRNEEPSLSTTEILVAELDLIATVLMVADERHPKHVLTDLRIDYISAVKDPVNPACRRKAAEEDER